MEPEIAKIISISLLGSLILLQGAMRNPENYKFCPRCKIEKHVNEYYRYKNVHGDMVPLSFCAECQKAYKKEKRANDSEN